MEFEDVSEKVKWESDRIAAAFEMRNWERGQYVEAAHLTFQDFYGYCFDVQIRWSFDVGRDRLLQLHVGTDMEECGLFLVQGQQEDRWTVYSCAPFNEIMGKGLYRLGIENYECDEELPPLSAHQKLELRLSMPREFWPKTWLDEESREVLKE